MSVIKSRKTNHKCFKCNADNLNYNIFNSRRNCKTFMHVYCSSCNFEHYFNITKDLGEFTEDNVLSLISGNTINTNSGTTCKLNHKGKIIWLIDKENPYPSSVLISKRGQHYLYKGFAIRINNCIIIENKKRFITINNCNMQELVDNRGTFVDGVFYEIDYDKAKKQESFTFATLKLGLSL